MADEKDPDEVEREESGRRVQARMRCILDDIDEINMSGDLSPASIELSNFIVEVTQELSITRGSSPSELFGFGRLQQALRSLATSSMLVSEAMKVLREIPDFAPLEENEKKATEDEGEDEGESSCDPEPDCEGCHIADRCPIRTRIREIHDIN